MGYFQVRYDARVVNYDRRGFIRLATGFEPWAAGWKAHINPLSRCWNQTQGSSNDKWLHIRCLDRSAIQLFVASVTRKNRLMFIKVAQNDFTRKMKDFNTLTKIA